MQNSTANRAYKKPRFDLTYLIETDHRFTDYKSYTSSDYLLSRLSMDPSMAQKRLGDGFYEQKLISDQITQLTGRRFVGQYTSTEDQTRALMDSSVGAAQQLKLSTGIALSKEQAAALTQDIVWMVEEQITLIIGDRPRFLDKITASSLRNSHAPTRTHRNTKYPVAHHPARQQSLGMFPRGRGLSVLPAPP